jgi:hypothetical protein
MPNPQPLPPKIEVADLTETVTAAVLRAIKSVSVKGDPQPNPWRNPRIICGIIAEPVFLRAEGE